MDSSDQKLVDQLCDEFESELSAGSRPRISQWLQRVGSNLESELFSELVALEHELLDGPDFQQQLADYANQFPQFASAIATYRQPNLILKESETGPPTKTESADTVIGNYKLLSQIGVGGMGSVWLAQQDKPVRRRVAVKIIKSGMDSKEVIARFEAERQALAMMDHPNIAKILDAGTTALGQPFFAMELVKGMPITEYCDHRRIGIQERLELCRQLCEGVQHAHQKGIIHRDLKPSNILVTEIENKKVVKIIDFGLAKALNVSTRLTDKTMFTEFGQVLGTLKYMSPEQAGQDSLDVDTRSDVYAIGIILYELLTGETPLASESFEQMALLQVLELVRDYKIIRPSSKLFNSGQDSSLISQKRQINLSKLNEILSGDLDWIVMKSLEKDRTRRYETPIALADDLLRFQRNEPVQARPPSRAYLISKFVRRNRGLVFTATTIATVLVVAASVCLLMAVELNKQRNEALFERERAAASEKRAIDASQEAIAERDNAKQALTVAEQETRKAEQQRAIAGTVLDFFQSNLLRQANVYEQANDGTNNYARKELTVADALEKSATEFSPAKIDQKFPQQYEVQASILESMADTFSAIELHDSALKMSKGGLAVRKRLVEKSGLGQFYAGEVRHTFVLLNAGKHVTASRHFANVLKGLHELLSDASQPQEATPDRMKQTANGMPSVDDQVTMVVNEVASRLNPKSIDMPPLQIDKLKFHEYPIIINAVNDGLYYVPRLLEKVRERYSNDDFRTQYILLMSGFTDHFASEMQRALPAGSFSRDDSLDQAVAKYLSVKEFTIEHFPEKKLEIAGLDMVLSIAYARKYGDTDDRVFEAIQNAARVCREELPAGHPAVITNDNKLASALFKRNRFKEALPLYRSVAEGRRRMLGTNSLTTLISISDIGTCHYQLAKREADTSERMRHLKSAIDSFEESTGLLIDNFGVSHPSTSYILFELGLAYLETESFKEAENCLRQAWAIGDRATDKKTKFEHSIKLSALAFAQFEQGRLEEAQSNLSELLQIRDNFLADNDHPLIKSVVWRLAQIHDAQSDRPELKKVLNRISLDSFGAMTIKFSDSSTDFSGTANNEFEMFGWPIDSFDLVKLNGGTYCQRQYVAAPSRRVANRLIYKTTPDEFPQVESTMEQLGFQLIQTRKHQIGQQDFIASLWHKPK